MITEESNVNIDKLKKHFRNEEKISISKLGETKFFQQSIHSIPVNIIHGKEEYIIYADLCGVDKENIDLEVTGKTLKISATRDESIVAALYDNEIFVGKLIRLIELENHVDYENINASMKHGLLKVTLPINTRKDIVKIEIE